MSWNSPSPTVAVTWPVAASGSRVEVLTVSVAEVWLAAMVMFAGVIV